MNKLKFHTTNRQDTIERFLSYIDQLEQDSSWLFVKKFRDQSAEVEQGILNISNLCALLCRQKGALNADERFMIKLAEENVTSYQKIIKDVLQIMYHNAYTYGTDNA